MIVDSFLFNDELDLLKIRLEYLSRYVDKYYIAEAPINTVGKEKELHFLKNSHKFKKYLNKIERIEVCKNGEYSTLEKEFGLKIIKSSSIEATSRNQFGPQLSSLSKDTLIHYSDVDEIPKVEKLRGCKFGRTYLLSGALYYYFYNLKCTNFPLDRLPWGIVTAVKNLSDTQTLSYYRNLVGQIQARYLAVRNEGVKVIPWIRLLRETRIIEKTYKVNILKNSCYHFSYMGGIEAIKKNYFQLGILKCQV